MEAALLVVLILVNGFFAMSEIGLVSGIVGEATFAPPLETQLEGPGVPMPAAGYSATAIVVALITFFPIVVGELVRITRE